ncbi:MAG: hypothetical protein KDB14_03365 [Planctomycetales bacterium]|nr:hypothetical protein [Planctomycetales bacterium]
MTPANTQQRDREVALITWLHFAEGKPYEQIADQLSISPRTVSRRLEEAKSRGWVVAKPVLNIPEQHLPRSITRPAPEELRRLVDAWNPGAEVQVYVVEGDQHAYCHEAANLLMPWLMAAMKVGVSWGRTLNGVIGAVCEEDQAPSLHAAWFETLPLCPEPLILQRNEQSLELSSTQLAAKLGQLVQRTSNSGHQLRLSGVPAYLPRRMRDAMQMEGRDFFSGLSRDYCRLFVEDTDGRPRVDSADVMLTGCGELSDTRELTGTFIRERLANEGGDLSEARLRRCVLGDISGILLPRETISKADRQLVDSLNAGWLGVTQRQLQDCHRRHYEAKSAGVVLLTLGAGKARVVQQGIRMGMVSRIITDRQCADAMLALASTDSRRRRSPK